MRPTVGLPEILRQNGYATAAFGKWHKMIGPSASDAGALLDDQARGADRPAGADPRRAPDREDEAINLVLQDKVDAMIADFPICVLSVQRFPDRGLYALLTH